MSWTGVDSFACAHLTKDDSTGVTYDTIRKMVGLRLAGTDITGGLDTLFADNAPFENSASLGKIKFSLEFASLSLADECYLTGGTVVNGVTVDAEGDDPPLLGCMFRGLKANGKYRYVRLLKGRFTKPKEEHKTKEEKANMGTTTLDGEFLVRVYDKQWRHRADEDDTDFVATIGTTWFDSFETPKSSG